MEYVAQSPFSQEANGASKERPDEYWHHSVPAEGGIIFESATHTGGPL